MTPLFHEGRSKVVKWTYLRGSLYSWVSTREIANKVFLALASPPSAPSRRTCLHATPLLPLPSRVLCATGGCIIGAKSRSDLRRNKMAVVSSLMNYFGFPAWRLGGYWHSWREYIWEDTVEWDTVDFDTGGAD